MIIFTQEQIAYINGWMSAKNIGKCPVCNLEKSTLAIENKLFEIEEFDPNKGMKLIIGQDTGRPRHPFVVIYCKACGYSLLFSAVMIGLIQKFFQDNQSNEKTEDKNEPEPGKNEEPENENKGPTIN